MNPQQSPKTYKLDVNHFGVRIYSQCDDQYVTLTNEEARLLAYQILGYLQVDKDLADKTVQQQYSKVRAYLTLHELNLPVPPDLKREVEDYLDDEDDD